VAGGVHHYSLWVGRGVVQVLIIGGEWEEAERHRFPLQRRAPEASGMVARAREWRWLVFARMKKKCGQLGLMGQKARSVEVLLWNKKKEFGWIALWVGPNTKKE
jgi:hypothetical protein